MRRAGVSMVVGDTATAREQLSVALSLAKSPPRDLDMMARTLAVLAEVEILDEKWSDSEAYLRRAAALHGEVGGFARDRAEHPPVL